MPDPLVVAGKWFLAWMGMVSCLECRCFSGLSSRGFPCYAGLGRDDGRYTFLILSPCRVSSVQGMPNAFGRAQRVGQLKSSDQARAVLVLVLVLVYHSGSTMIDECCGRDYSYSGCRFYSRSLLRVFLIST